MAAAAYYLEDGLGDQTSDLGVLWQQALQNYKDKCGVDLSSTGRDKWNMSTIEAEQARQLDLFSKFRHDKGLTDKLRSLVGRNTKIIQSVATHVANAASSAFPPSAAILTAFNYCLNASKAVSEDYDMIVSFFDVMNSFLERINLLEQRLPPDRSYQIFVMNVFNALLEVCAIAKRYRDDDHGRFKKWAKAMVEGNDSKLKASYALLNTHLQRWESATLVMTLKTAIDSSRKIDALAAGQQDILAQGAEHMTITTQIRTMTIDVSSSQKESLALQKKTLGFLEAMSKKQADGAGGNQQMDAGARKSTALMRVKAELSCWADVGGQFDEYKSAYIRDTFDWVSAESGYKQICAEETPLWWISGVTGMGKSTVVYKTILSLQRDFHSENTSSVAYFFFRNDLDQLGLLTNMFKWCATQAAEQDERYREDILTDIQRGAPLWDVDPRKYLDKLWDRLFVSQYGKDSGRRLILVLDGIDQASEVGQKKLMEMLRETSSKETKIQIIFTCDAAYRVEDEALKLEKLQLDKPKVTSDMKKVAFEGTKKLPRLKKLSRSIRFRIARVLTQKADSMAYIEHTLRRLENIGREGPILKELNRLPETSSGLYDLLLRDCTKGRNNDEKILLRKLFAWIAYSQKLIDLPLLHKVIETAGGESDINVDEELQYRSARLLRVYNQNFEKEEDAESSEDEKDKDGDKSDDEQDRKENEADSDLLIGFHDQSLRLFFRYGDTGPYPLRSAPSIGNLMILEDVAATLTVPRPENATAKDRSAIRYACRFWKSHLKELKREDLTDEQAATVVQIVYDILQNKGAALKKIASVSNYRVFTALGDTKEMSEEYLDVIALWAQHALALPASYLSATIIDTMRAITEDKRRTYFLLARGHIQDWYTAESEDVASWAFRAAHTTLEQASDALPADSDLRAYYEKCKGSYGVAYGFDPPIEAFMTLANAFPNIPKNAQAYCSIAKLMLLFGHVKSSIDLFRTSFANITDKEPDRELFELHFQMAKALFPTEEDRLRRSGLLNEKETGPFDGEDDEARTARVTEALNHLNQAILHRPSAIPEDDYDSFLAVSETFARRIQAELELGRLEAVVPDMGEFMAEMAKHETNFKGMPADIIPIVAAMAKKEQWEGIIAIMKMVRPRDRSEYFSRLYGATAAFEQAGVMTGETQYVLDVFAETDKQLSEYWVYPSAVVRRAEFRVQALRTPDDIAEAKRLLNGVLDVRKEGAASNVMGLSGAAFCMADILLQQFRDGRDGTAKTAALDGMKILVSRMAEIVGKGFDPSQSQLSIPLALMTRRLGPASDFQQTLAETFDGCVEALKDTIGWNDCASFRMLAKTLSCVPGLEREASVALTCQMYIVDMDIYKREKEADGMVVKDDQQQSEVKPTDEDLDPLAEITCNDCCKTVTDLKSGAVYLCYYCTEMDLCEECYLKRAAIERGERPADWRVLCPKGHKHIKAPVEGWRGLKDGVLKMDVDIKFDDWLDELKVKWDAAWVEFWDEE